VKANSEAITLNDLCEIYKKILIDKTGLVLLPADTTVIDLIIEEADKIAVGADDHIELESKVVISIAIRLLAEKHMIRRINNPVFMNTIKKNQTIELLKEYKRNSLGNSDELEKLEQVNLMTPENIHLNSFMYEPILDMGSAHLRSLYSDIKMLAQRD